MTRPRRKPNTKNVSAALPKKKVGGVRVTMRRVDEPQRRVRQDIVPSGMCVCGKTAAQCVADWDTQLGVTGHTADSQAGPSEYERNLAVQREAWRCGDDPYCFRATLAAEGYRSDWTPYLPSGSFSLPLIGEALDGTERTDDHRITGSRGSRNTKRGGRG